MSEETKLKATPAVASTDLLADADASLLAMWEEARRWRNKLMVAGEDRCSWECDVLMRAMAECRFHIKYTQQANDKLSD